MAVKKASKSSSDDQEDLARAPLQAVLLADSFATKFRPITLERPKVLLPLVNVPMIDYTLAWLESEGVEEVFVFCCAHANQVKDYLNECRWTKQTSTFSVSIIESRISISAGDALRVIDSHGVIRGDFILISGDTVSNMNLAQALQEHKERRKKDPLAVMTMVIKHLKSSPLIHQTRLGEDMVIMGIHPETKELLYYEETADHLRQVNTLDKSLLADNPALLLQNDKQDCYIDICSAEVLSLFTDNFDYQHLRRHFVKGLLVDDVMEYKIFTYETSSYVARVDNFRSYDTISKDIIQRWPYPFTPSIQYFDAWAQIKVDRREIYTAPDTMLSHSAHIGPGSFVGSGTTIGDGSVISMSVIGRGCNIGQNVLIEGSYIWDNVIIEDGCKLSHALICDGVHLGTGVVLEPGVILSFKVEVTQKLVVPVYSKVSLLPQPSKQDSDEELEYADSNSGVVESPSFATVMNARYEDLMPDATDTPCLGNTEVGPLVGYIWTVCEGGQDEEWRHSIAPIPKEKLEKFSSGTHEDHAVANQDECSIQTSGELLRDSDGTDFDDGDAEDYRDSADFEKEMEATFLRALTGVDLENVIIEINSLRLSYNMSHADCAGALFYAIMKSALAAQHSNNAELCANTKKEISKWKDLLKYYLKSQDEEIEVILKFEEICLETVKAFRPLFTNILNHLYDAEVLTEEAILAWEREKEGADEFDKILVKQAEPFITWLKEASEEDEDDD